MKKQLFYATLITTIYYALFLPLHYGLAADDVITDFTAIDVRINEILPNPEGSDADGEFIEIYNSSDDDIDLTDWKIITRSSGGTEKEQALSLSIPSHGFVELESTNDDFTFTLTNSFLTIVFLAPDNTVISEFDYENAPSGQSFNYHEDEWYWSDPTLGEVNEKLSDDIPNDDYPLDDFYPPLILNELLPNPIDDEDREFIEIYNPNKFDVPLNRWTLHDGSKSGEFTFDDGVIAPQSYFITKRSDFKFALNNTGAETVTLLDPLEEVRDTVTYEGARENFVYAFNESEWQWSPKHTPGQKNVFVKPPKITIDAPRNIYRNVPAPFSISIDDIDKSDFSVRWDFGDDSPKSTKKEVSHIYTKKGDVKGIASVKIDGQTIIKEFDVDIKKYPKRMLDIVNILPNPVGADTGAEYITIKNVDDKKVDLGGWRIAIGSHPTVLRDKRIADNIKLAPQEVFTITREHALFTLPNRSGTIELRRPDGTSTAHLEYTLPPKTKEGAIYEKYEHVWRWIAQPDDDTYAEKNATQTLNASAIIAQALHNEQLSAAPKNARNNSSIQDVNIDGLIADAERDIENTFMKNKKEDAKRFFKKITNIIAMAKSYLLP